MQPFSIRFFFRHPLPIPQIDLNWLKLTQNDSKWLKLTQIEFGWLKITSNDSKMPYRVKMLWVDGLTQIDSYWPKITTNDSKWLKMFLNGLKWLKTKLECLNVVKILKKAKAGQTDRLTDGPTKWLIESRSTRLKMGRYYGSKPFESTHGGKEITHSPTRSTALHCAALRSALPRSAPLCSTPLCAAPLPGSNEKVAMY